MRTSKRRFGSALRHCWGGLWSTLHLREHGSHGIREKMGGRRGQRPSLGSKKNTRKHPYHPWDDCIFTYIYRKNQPIAGKYTMDGLYGLSKRVNQQDDSIWCGCVKIMSIHICRYIYLDILYTYISVFYSIQYT